MRLRNPHHGAACHDLCAAAEERIAQGEGHDPHGREVDESAGENQEDYVDRLFPFGHEAKDPARVRDEIPHYYAHDEADKEG